MAEMLLFIVAVVIVPAPVWVLALMLVWHGLTAKKFWQFSMGFLMALVAAECVALAISIPVYRWLSTPWDWPVPG